LRQHPYLALVRRQATDQRHHGEDDLQSEQQQVQARHDCIMPRPTPDCRARPAEDAMSLDPVALRDVYDAQLRAWMPPVLPAGAVIDQDGPLVRVAGLDERGFVTYRSLAGLSGDDVDGLIGRARDHFAARGQAVEWKLHGHDTPGDLPERLRRAGF